MPYIPVMNEVHLASVDLNLLVALDALLDARNVTRAAARVGITQSAMSHALARLRALTGDALLVRGGDGLVRTARAEALAEPVRRALGELARALAPPEPFDPRTARGRIVVGTSDYAELVLLPSFVARLARDAPGIDLRVRAIGDDFVPLLASGEIDLAIAPVAQAEGRAGVLARRLFAERFVCVMRKGHPLAAQRLTLARFVAASHALISPRGKEGGIVDEALARLGHARRVAVAVPHFLIAPHVVAASDLLLTLAERVATTLAKPLGLAIRPMPSELRLEGFTMSAIWHERTSADPAQRWARDLFAEVARGA
jgi:DNA-binding transcriptional LysR family regulator